MHAPTIKYLVRTLIRVEESEIKIEIDRSARAHADTHARTHAPECQHIARPVKTQTQSKLVSTLITLRRLGLQAGRNSGELGRNTTSTVTLISLLKCECFKTASSVSDA